MSDYAEADAADCACQAKHCLRSDCNGFLCRNALDAAIAIERERCAKIAEEHAGAVAEMAAAAYYSSAESAALNMGRGIAAAIRTDTAQKQPHGNETNVNESATNGA